MRTGAANRLVWDGDPGHANQMRTNLSKLGVRPLDRMKNRLLAEERKNMLLEVASARADRTMKKASVARAEGNTETGNN
jgi:hypothetical protein